MKSAPRQKSDSYSAWRVFGIPALIALLGYVFVYGCDARLRRGRGPWEVTFFTETNGTPALRIGHPKLGISNVVVRFLAEHLDPTNHVVLPQSVAFERPRSEVPFGTLVFDDLMYLPGTVVLHCFGHEVQMLPRTLYLNRKEVRWGGSTTNDLHPADKLPDLNPPTAPRKYL